MTKEVPVILPEGAWGVILSRRDSVRLPGKALRPLGGVPMITYSFEAVRHSQLLTQRWLFTDCPQARALALAYGIRVPSFERPKALNGPGVSSEDTLRYFLQQFPALPPVVALLQPTSPLRLPEDIDAALTLFAQRPDCDRLMSVCPPWKPLDWHYRLDTDGCLTPLPMDAGPWRLPNGAIYLFRTDRFLAGGLPGPTLAFDMPAERSIDVDTDVDFRYAESMLLTPSPSPSKTGP